MSITNKAWWGVLVLAGAVAPGCVTAATHMALQDELAKTQDELAYTRDELAKAEDLLTTAELSRDELDRLRQALEAERLAKAEIERKLKEFQQKESALAGQGWEGVIDPEEGMYGYRSTQGDVFFASGSADLTKTGKTALDAVVDLLKRNKDPIRVAGHTDVDPVNKTKDRFPKGNIQLGAERAMSVRAYLVERGIDEGRISIASYGEYKPVRPGKDAESKARNRRVEIMQPLGRPVAKG